MGPKNSGVGMGMEKGSGGGVQEMEWLIDLFHEH